MTIEDREHEQLLAVLSRIAEAIETTNKRLTSIHFAIESINEDLVPIKKAIEDISAHQKV
jgi:hypothetical protein